MVHIAEITRERLESWGRSCIQGHATPILLVAIGHDHAAGEVKIIQTDDLTAEQLEIFLEYALRCLRTGRVNIEPVEASKAS